MTPDRHLGAAWADRCEPTVLISESTYATTIRDSKRCRESYVINSNLFRLLMMELELLNNFTVAFV